MNEATHPASTDIDRSHYPHRSGWIEVICGPMFSGKTEELIRRLRRAQIAKQEVAIFKPQIDDRFSADHLVSHSDSSLPSTSVRSAREIMEKLGNATVLGIDEAQFFGNELVEICRKLAAQGCRVIVAGLDQDYRCDPFEPVPQLLAEAEYITKTLAICVKCGAPGSRTQRLSTESERVIVGAQDRYEARCRYCHEILADDQS
ncbi:thymidine kinase [candidate division LCP-89 bacterium B3_LCP]|uniref:Thymidine kinase n=1 Tax=candidate division LCP-89 bacterium B3_LCP TaxID=2012998 RepID=A0A532UYS7_UNCL8|nr:MAG: thymidine kinase [candidate division LCP-89 bacterium B3_LCP]